METTRQRKVSKLIQRIGRSRHSKGSSAKGLIVTNNADDEYEEPKEGQWDGRYYRK